MPWKEADTMSLKTQFVLRAVSGRESMSELCREFGISRKTGHKWRDRFMAQGMTGLEERPRRPVSSPGSLGEEAVCRLVELKLAHPHWGARKIAALWERSYSEPVPSESSIKRVLLRAGLVAERKRRVRPDGVRLSLSREKPKEPNELWTVDFKGWWLSREKRRCEPLTVRDGYSRYVLCARPLESSRGDAVRQAFERLFERHGLPGAIRSDNGSPFASRRAPLGLSRLSSWWVSLGISLDRIEPGRPADQNGAHERLHRDIALEVESAAQRSRKENEVALELWRRSYNEERPHEALSMSCPAEHYRDSARFYTGTPEDIDYPEGYIVRGVHKRLGTVKFRRKQIFISTAVGGWSVGLKPRTEEEVSVWFSNLNLGVMNLRTESFSPARAGENGPTLDPKSVT